MPHASALTGLAGAAAALLLLAECARAGDTVTDAAIGVAALHFEFEEFDAQDRRLVRESGWLPGVAGGFSLRRQRLTLSADFEYYAGDTDYDGRTSAGAPVNSSTDQRMLDAAFNAAWQLPIDIPPQVYVHAGGGWRHWKRDIQSVGAVSGLDERYRWWRAEAGMQLRWPAGDGQWLVDARVTRTLDPQLDVNFGGTLDDVSLDLGERWGWSALAGWLQPVAERVTAGVSVFYRYWELGSSRVETLSSNGLPAGSVFQPRSESRNYGAILSLRHHW